MLLASLVLVNTIRFPGIRLSFYGGSKVSYIITETKSGSSAGHSMHERKERTMYRSIEEYFNHTMYVFGARKFHIS